jgi:hypothetical protein
VSVTGAQGVYGQSLYSASIERIALRGTELEASIKKMNILTNRVFLNQMMEMPVPGKVSKGCLNPYLRRLEFIQEPSYKVRNITIGDF